MKAKGLIVLSAILMMVIAIGCSNSRTTAPINANDQFAISGDANNGRFDNSDPSVPVVAGGNPIWITLRGNIAYQGTQCVTIKLPDETYLELNIKTNTPIRIPNGSAVLVIGNYTMTPGGRCEIYKTFDVSSIKLIGENANHTIR
jgi:hypothetical protein